MMNPTRTKAISIWLVVLTVLLAAPVARGDAPASWQPTAWQSEDTIELRTQAPGEDPYWFKVWLVVLDGELYVRLGSKAASRVEESETRPVLGVRIAGLQFDRVMGEPAPDQADAVAAAMADKYWTDVFVRYLDHPLTLRLTPAS